MRKPSKYAKILGFSGSQKVSTWRNLSQTHNTLMDAQGRVKYLPALPYLIPAAAFFCSNLKGLLEYLEWLFNCL